MKNLTHFINFSTFSCAVFMGGVIYTIIGINKYTIKIDTSFNKVDDLMHKNVERRGVLLNQFSFFFTKINNTINKSILILK
jgi:hypothetical protein